MGETITKGKSVEQYAKQFLRKNGLRFIEENYRCNHGEIDLVMQDADSIVFVEVRYRKHQSYGSGAESIDFRKQRKLIASASHYLQTHRDAAKQPCRFDVISVGNNNSLDSEPYEIQWISNAFEA
ncbi:YraN family protein [Kaarinaea lacus]